MDEKTRREIARKLGDALSRARQRAEMTQGDAAEALGIGPEAISRIERGAVDITVLRAIEFAEAYHCGLSDLLLYPSPQIADSAGRLAEVLQSQPPERVRDAAGLLSAIAEALDGRAR